MQSIINHFPPLDITDIDLWLCLGVQQSDRVSIKLCVRQLINFSKLYQIYQDIVLTQTLTITPSPNSDFRFGLYFRYFGLLRNLSPVGHGVLMNPCRTVGNCNRLSDTFEHFSFISRSILTYTGYGSCRSSYTL